LPPNVARQIAVAGALQPGALALDIGAGTGRVSIAPAGIGCKVVSLDPELPMLNELRRKTPEPKLAVLAA
jgi:ubiquinone/menaquinone biosynthesis C-methylase UbiE